MRTDERAVARLRVGFDGRTLASPAAGVRRYVAELVTAMVQLEDAPQLVMLGGPPDLCPPGVTYAGEPSHPPTNAGWVLVGLPLAARTAAVDLIHAPAYTAPFWSPAPIVLTIHDVSYARHPEWFPYRRDALRRAYYRRSALSASMVITDSAFSAGEITAAYGIPPSRIIVIPLGVNQAMAAEGEHAPPSTVQQPYVLHVGDLHERRNLPMVLRAVLAARHRAGAGSLSLVLAGVDRGVGEGLRRTAREAGAPDAVAVLGAVGEDDLRALYQHASALVYPSRYEGFGLPLVEAMACGVPVVAARAASIPEVVGDAGVLLDPDDEPAWTTALLQMLTAGDRATQLGAAGRARARTFTWDTTARRTLDVYRQVAGGAGRTRL